MNIEELLLAKLAQEKEQSGAAPIIGAASGAVIGGLAGQGAHTVGNQINKLKDRLAEGQGLSRSRMQNLKGRVTPGNRMAGGIVGLILGGALGEGTRRMMIEGSPTSQMLAKLQTNPEGLSEQDLMQLKSLLASTYKGIIGEG